MLGGNDLSKDILCQVCCKDIDNDTRTACNSCMPFWGRARAKWNDPFSDYDKIEEMARDLKELFDEQNGLCKLSGVSLMKDGKNTWHVDRKTPGARYNREGIQLLNSSVNYAKHQNDNQAFVWLCAKVVRNMLDNKNEFVVEVETIKLELEKYLK